MEAKIANLERERFFTKNYVKILENTAEKNNSAFTRCMETLESLNGTVKTPEKVPNQSSST